jgi:hypothetical protein
MPLLDRRHAGGAGVSARHRLWGVTIAIVLALAASGASARAAEPDTGAIANGGFGAGVSNVNEPRFPGDPNPLAKGVPTHWTIAVSRRVDVGGWPYPRIGASITPECAVSRRRELPFVHFDVPGSSEGSIEQTIEVPRKPFPLTFTAWGNNEPATLRVEIITSDGARHPLLSFAPRALGPTSEGACLPGARPEHRQVDMAAFAGQRVTLRFVASSQNHLGAIANLDDVSLPADAGLGHDCERGGRHGKPYQVTAGPLAAVGCWREDGDTAVARQPVRVNGIDLRPHDAGTEIRIDKRRDVIGWNGALSAKVGSLPLGRLGAGLHWRARAVTLIDYSHEPNKRDPKAPAGAKRRKLLGLPLAGAVELKFDAGKTALKLNAEMPKLKNPLLGRLAGLSAELTAAATNRDGLVLDGAELQLPSFAIKWIELTDAKLTVSRTAAGAHHFDGGLTVYPFRSLLGPGLQGEFGWGIGDDYLKVGFGAENFNRHLAYGIFLQRISAALQRDPFGFAGAIAATFGPQIRIPGQGLLRAVRADGAFSYLDPHDSDGDGSLEPREFKITSDLEILLAKARESTVRLSGGQVDIDSKSTLLKVGEYGFESATKGWVTRGAFNLEGSGTISLPGPDGGGEAVISTTGVAACKRGFGPDIGWGRAWGDLLPQPFAWGCNLGAWRGRQPASAAASGAVPAWGAQGSRALEVRPGTRRLALRVQDQGAPPPVTFVAPDGTRYQPTSQPDSAVVTDTAIAFQDPSTSATYLAVDQPLAGRWQLEVPASLPTRPVLSRGRSLGPLGLRARVTGHGSSRVLHYRLRNRAGRRVTFVEQGGASRKLIGHAMAKSGRIRYRPAYGPRGRRRIVALASLAGSPAPEVEAARYRTRAVRPPLPRSVRVRRAPGHRRVISWRGPNSLAYVVVVRTGDGRRLRYLRRGGRRRVVVRAVPANTKVGAHVTAISRDGVRGRPARARTSNR